MIPAEAPVCEADDELHVRHDVGSKQLAVHPGTAGLDTRPPGEGELGEGGGEGELGEGGGEGELGEGKEDVAEFGGQNTASPPEHEPEEVHKSHEQQRCVPVQPEYSQSGSGPLSFKFSHGWVLGGA